MKYILLVLICTTALLSAQDIPNMPNDYDRFVINKIDQAEKEIANLEAKIHYSICPEYTKKDPAKIFSEPEAVLLYLKGKRDAYSEFLYELD